MTVSEFQDRPGEMLDRALAGEVFCITRGSKRRVACFVIGPARYRELRDHEKRAPKKKARVA